MTAHFYHSSNESSAISEEKGVTVYDVAFYPAEALDKGGYKCQTDYDQKRFLLSEVSPRYFSEILLLLTRATVLGEEKL